MLIAKEVLDMDSRKELQALARGKLLWDVPMGPHTTFGLGGPADAWVEPQDARDLAAILDFCSSRGIPHFIMGHGTNLLVKDGGIRGVVLRLGAPAFRQIAIEGTRVVAGAGLSNAKLLESLKAAGLGDMEFVCGIPGCVGGGVAMNAGAHGNCFADVLDQIQVMDGHGGVRVLPRAAMDFEYRSLRNLGDTIVVSATFTLTKEDGEGIRSRIAQFLEIRNATQPKGSGPGCIFKNPPNGSAGRLIDALGLKGLRVGGAWVSEIHGNFILNDRHASSAHVLELIQIVQEQVRAKSGVCLQTEVKIVGE